MTDYTYADDTEVQIRLDLSHAASGIEYRTWDYGEADWRGWKSTPFQRGDVRSERDALGKVIAWLGE